MSSELRTQVFPTTDWRLISDAGLDGSHRQRLSISELLTRYLPAMRDYLLRRQRLSEDDVDDVVQEFATAKMLSGAFFAKADPTRGRFRSFLARSLEHWFIDRYRRESREKLIRGDADIEGAASSSTDPLHIFELAWAENAMAEAIRRAHERCRRTKREKVWEFFMIRMVERGDDGGHIPYRDLAQQFGFESPAQMANAVVTCKRIFLRMLEATLREQAGGGPDVDVKEELADLQEILGRASAGI